MLSQILKHTADYQFSMQPYDGAFMERMPEEWKQNKGLYPVSLLRNYIEKSGRRWVDTMMNDYSMRLAEASPGKRFITAVVPVLELRKMIQKVESMQQNPRKRSIRIMDFLQKCPTDKVALIILLRKEETPLEEMPSLRPMKESLRVGLDREDFKAFDPSKVRRGSFILDRRGHFGLVFAGFPLTGKTPESGSPLFALMLDDKDGLDGSVKVMISDTGLLPDGSQARLNPTKVCDAMWVDRLFERFSLQRLFRGGEEVSLVFDFDRAFCLAGTYFKGIKDMGGQPYLLHVMRVASEVRTDSQRVLALLHDTLTMRTGVTVQRMLKDGVPLSVIQLLVSFCPVPGEEFYDYIARLKRSEDVVAVKKACLRDDMILGRLNRPVTDEDMDRKNHMLRTYNLLTIRKDE